MVGFFKSNKLHNVVLSSILCTFPLAVITPPFAYGQINLNLNEVNFGIKLQKLIDKAYKYYDKLDSNTHISPIFIFNQHFIQVEGSLGKSYKLLIQKDVKFFHGLLQYLSRSLYVLHVFQKKSKKGRETPKEEMDIVKNRLKIAEQKHEEWLKKVKDEKKNKNI